jgi:GNAT superfamily N-acetyltransferase
MGREELIRRLQETWREIEPGQDVTVGPFRPEDALGVALAYYETYGGSFPLEHVYDPEEILRRNATDDQHTVVARTPRGEVVGLAGLFRHAPNPGLYEAGQLMVLPGYRRGKVAASLQREVFDRLRPRLGLPAFFLEATGNHTASQHLAHSDGLVFTGLEVECMPSLAYAKEGGARRNVSLFLMFKVFERSSCAVCLPEAYREFCEARYAELALPRVASPAAELSGETRADRFSLPESGLLRLNVHRPGKDFAGVVAAAEAQAGNTGTVQAFLNLGDAATPRAVDVLRGRGYFLVGLLPYWFGPDGLAMQKIPREPDWDAIQVCGPEAEAVRRVVREDFERVRAPGPGS